MLGPFKPEVQMLYGPLGQELGEELLCEGYPVRIYIPFVAEWCQGAWLPYGMRRAATIRHLFFADKEVRRTKLQELKNKFRRR
jgi:proline dehydrogenase